MRITTERALTASSLRARSRQRSRLFVGGIERLDVELFKRHILGPANGRNRAEHPDHPAADLHLDGKDKRARSFEVRLAPSLGHSGVRENFGEQPFGLLIARPCSAAIGL